VSASRRGAAAAACRARAASAVVLAVVLVIVSASSTAAVRAQPPGPEPGDLLIAARDLEDPNFARTVVLLLAVGPDGAAGVVLNRRTPVRVAAVLPKIDAMAKRADTLLWGGPVEPTSALVLARLSEPPAKGTTPVVDDVYAVRTPDGIQRLLERGLPETSLRVFSGYAGWTAGQLEAETAVGSWHRMRADAERIFTGDVEGLWEKLVRIARLPLA
jgi:putative transcriptional regulator